MSKHLTLEDRYLIFDGLNQKMSLCQIAKGVHKHPSTITSEITKHYLTEQTGAYGRVFNDCRFRKTCPDRKDRRTATPCFKICSDYQKENCHILEKPPYVCNGCLKRSSCTLEKRLYKPDIAHRAYLTLLKEARAGFALSEDQTHRIDTIVSPLLKQGQSIHHIMIHHKDQLMISEKTLYRLVHSGLLSARPLDCPRMVRFKTRNIPKSIKVDTACRHKRSYQEFLAYTKQFPELSVIEMDTLEGTKGGKVLLTLIHPPTGLTLAYLRDFNDSASVTFLLNRLKKQLGLENYCRLFSIILTDNGSEFSNPKAIEEGPLTNDMNLISKVFYCDPRRPEQKPHIENSHALLRRIFPKGFSFDQLTQEHIDLAINHINAYAIKKLNDRSPFDAFSFLFGPHWLESLNLTWIPPNEINLTPHLIK